MQLGKCDGAVTGRCHDCGGYGDTQGLKSNRYRPAGDPKPPKAVA